MSNVPMNFIKSVLVALCALCVAGCVSTQVTSAVIAPSPSPVERIAVVVRHGTFSSSNLAASLGQRNLDGLTPYLNTRVPAVFTLNGIAARSTRFEAREGQTPGRIEPGEKVIYLTPVAARYSDQAGQSLMVRADLLDPARRAPIWLAEIHMHTLGYGKFDEKVATAVAVQMLEKLRADGVIHLPEGPIRTE